MPKLIKEKLFPTILVDLIPSDEFVSVLGGAATFRCFTTIPGTTIVSVEWLVNGTLLTNLVSSFRNVSVTFNTVGGGVGILQFADLPLEYNNTQISCNATFSTGQFRSSTTTSILRILQGTFGCPDSKSREKGVGFYYRSVGDLCIAT